MMLYDILAHSARMALPLQANDGSMPPGQNGPYGDPETPVRNTAHWLITFLKVYELTGDKSFYLAAERAVNYLLGSDARPMNASFWCRMNPEKDFSNGLVGQAWVIEALIVAAKTFSRDDLITLAQNVFLLHPYDTRCGGWRIVHVDGSYGSLDFTFNHQLWFAASGALLLQARKNIRIASTVLDFLNRLEKHLAIYRSGLIKHRSGFFLAPTISRKIYNFVGMLRNTPTSRYMQMKSSGYHGFNLYGFALLNVADPSHRFWFSPKLKRTLDYAESKDFKIMIANSKYGYPYNPPGFEIPYAYEIFNHGTEKIKQAWVQEQLRRSFDIEQGLLTRNTEDPNTMSARLYEATRLNNYSICLTS